MKFTFKKEDERGEITIVFNGDSLEEVVAEFEKFLRGTGFDLGESSFALINFNDLEAAHDDFEFSEDEDEDGGNEGGNGSGNNSH
jgi:hypothetical protein